MHFVPNCLHAAKCPYLFFYGLFLLLSGQMGYAQAPVITGFSPTTACQGTPVTINGTDFKDVRTVKLGNLDAASFQVVDDHTITAIIANQAASGTITVVTPGGTFTTTDLLTINATPQPSLQDKSTVDAAFTNCNGNTSYTLIVANNSTTSGGGNAYHIDWGDNTAPFDQTDWPAGAQLTHTYTSQGYFPLTLTITPTKGCAKSVTYQFYNGKNPLASFTTTSSTTGLCAPADIEFQIGNWMNNSPGTRYEVDFGDNTPPLILQHPLNGTGDIFRLTHSYTKSSCPAPDFKATLRAINGCFTTTYTLDQIIVRTKPKADFEINPQVPCLNTPVCFTNRTANGYSGNSCNTNTTYLWDFGDGTTSTAETPPCHTYAAARTYTVTLTASNATCGDDVVTKTVTIHPVSPVPVAGTPASYCQRETAAQLQATGTGLLWYNNPTGGNGSPTAPTPSTATPGTYTWYVSQTLPNECESPRVPVVVTVKPLPAKPIVTSPVQLCQGQPATALTANGAGLLWYNTATGGTGSPIAPTPSTTTPGPATWYVSQTTNGCEGPRAAITVQVNPPAALPVVTSPLTYCQHQPAPALTATGTHLLWYTTETGGAGSSVAPTPSTATPGSTTWYVSQTTGCGEGPRAKITVTVNPAPSATIAYSPAVLCNTVTANASIAVTQTGTTGGTYSVTPGGLTIDRVTGAIDPSGVTAGVYTIRYAVTGTGGCTDFSTTTTVTINRTPQASINYPSICTADAPVPAIFTGDAGGTFASTAGLSINATTGLITPATSTPGTYHVTYTVPGAAPCPAFQTSVDVTVTKAPSATIAYTPAIFCNTLNTPSTPNLPVPVTQTGNTGGAYSATPATGLTVDANGAIHPAGATPGVYTIRYAIAGSGGCADYNATTTITINKAPQASISYPSICATDAATAPTITGATGGTFSSTTGLVINATTGRITPGTSTPGTYTVTYIIGDAPPCPGFKTTASVTITKAPSAAIRYPQAVFCNTATAPATPNPPVTVTQTGDAGGAYSATPATGLTIDANGTIHPAGATPGVYTIRYTIAGSGGCADYNTTATVTINKTPQASISYPNSPYCGSNTTPQPVTFSGATGGTFSAGPGLSIDPATGAINAGASTPGMYTVTYTIAAAPPCPGFSASAPVTIAESPVLTFAKPSQAICSGETALFTPVSTVANTTYTWAVVGVLPPNVTGVSTGALPGPNPTLSLSFTNTGTQDQTLTIRVQPVNPAQNPCPGKPYDLTLIIHPATPAPAATHKDFCMGAPAVALRVNALPGTTIKWYDQNNTLLNAAPVISTTLAGQFVYYATQSNVYGCESPKTAITATVHTTAKIVGSTQQDPAQCGVPSGSITLNLLDLNNGALPNVPVIVHYNKFQAPMTFSGTTNAAGKITIPLTAGTYSGFYIETSGSCPSQIIPDVFILKDPVPPAKPVAGYNPPVCSGQTLTLTALSPGNAQPGSVSYVWAGPAFGPEADTVRDATIAFPDALMAYAGTYAVYATQNGCISQAATFDVAISQGPSKPVIMATTPLCIGQDLTLQAFSSIPGNASLDYLWKGPNAGFPVHAPSAGVHQVAVTDAGIYSVTVTSSQTGCSVTTDTLVQIGGPPIVAFPQDTLIAPTGYKITLSPVITNAAEAGVLPLQSFTWTPMQELDCTDALCSSAIVTAKKDICYSVKVTNVYGCSGSDNVCIRVFCQGAQVFIPNAFAPNGNVPENRKLIIRGAGIASVKSFRVFNRWGKIMFERSNFLPNDAGAGWDGMVNGKMSDTGVYVYTLDVICENGTPYSYKGNVTLF